jgi:hypothetical protein
MLKPLALVCSMLIVLASSSGCGCSPILATSITRGRDVTLRPGEATTIVYSQGGGECGGESLLQQMRYLSSDTLVARIDSVSGRLTAIRNGEATVWLNYPGATLSPVSFTAQVLVHVL